MRGLQKGRADSGKHKYFPKPAIMRSGSERVRFHWRSNNSDSWGERGILIGKFLQRPKDFVS